MKDNELFHVFLLAIIAALLFLMLPKIERGEDLPGSAANLFTKGRNH